MASSLEFLVRVATDRSRAMEHRVAAVRLLPLTEDKEAAAAALNGLCSASDEALAVYVAAGRARAQLDIARARDLTLQDMSLAQFDGTAALAYDEAVAQHQRTSGPC